MQYTIIITHADGTTTHTHTNAPNAKTAHEHATNGNTANGIKPNVTDTMRAYPTTTNADGTHLPYNIMRGALQVAKRSAEKAEGGTPTQERIARELKAVNAKAGKPEAEALGTAYIVELMADISADSNDYFGYAYTGILKAIAENDPIDEQYHRAFLEINSYINSQRGATDKECSTEYITAEGGAIVTINQYVARIVKSGERYTPIDNGIMDSDTADRLGEALQGAMSLLTPRQKNIIALVTEGYSTRQIAEKLNIKSDGTIKQHLVNIRAKTLEYIEQNNPEFMALIKLEEVRTAHATRKADRHKGGQAAYMREYRARQKAIKQAQGK